LTAYVAVEKREDKTEGEMVLRSFKAQNATKLTKAKHMASFCTKSAVNSIPPKEAFQQVSYKFHGKSGRGGRGGSSIGFNNSSYSNSYKKQSRSTDRDRDRSRSKSPQDGRKKERSDFEEASFRIKTLSPQRDVLSVMSDENDDDVQMEKKEKIKEKKRKKRYSS